MTVAAAVIATVLLLGVAPAQAAAAPTPSAGPASGGTVVSVEQPARFTGIALGAGAGYGLDDDGHAYAWGDDSAGQLGIGTFERSFHPPVRVSNGALPADETFTTLVSGGFSAFGIGTDGRLYAWGNNRRGQLGDGTFIERSEPTGVLQDVVPAGVRIVEVAAAFSDTLALSSDGTVYGWGDRYGPTPTAVPRGAIPPDARIDAIAVGGYGAFFALTSDGEVFAWSQRSPSWGESTSCPPQLGLGDCFSHPPVEPTRIVQGAVPTGVTLTSISAGIAHAVALGSDGNAYIWGRGDGKNDYPLFSAPRALFTGEIPSGTTLVSAKADRGYGSSVVSADGAVYAWGRKGGPYYGSGDGTSFDRGAPVAVSQGAIPDGVTVEAVAGEASNTLMLGSDGAIYGWGSGENGVLGTETFGELAPVRGPNFRTSEVTFDGLAATSVTQTTTGANATTPAHAAGPVDVAVTSTLFGGDTDAGQPHTLTHPSGFTYLDAAQPPTIIDSPVPSTAPAVTTAPAAPPATAASHPRPDASDGPDTLPRTGGPLPLAPIALSVALVLLGVAQRRMRRS